MSYTEYENEFKNAQKNADAPYRMFVFDLKNSKKMDDYTRFDAQIKSKNTLQTFAKELQKFETQTGKSILLHDENVKLNLEFNLSNPNLSNPTIVCGDSFAISILRGSCSDKEMIDLFLKIAKTFDNKYPYNVSIANFETTDYMKATKECYIGYCLAELVLNKKHRKSVINEQQNINELEK